MTFAELNPPYSTIVADPPWLYQKEAGKHQASLITSTKAGQAERHYSTMTNEAIAALPVAELAAPQAHLYLWFTNPGTWGGRFSDLSPEAIARAWGFDFKTVITVATSASHPNSGSPTLSWRLERGIPPSRPPSSTWSSVCPQAPTSNSSPGLPAWAGTAGATATRGPHDH